jgi:hypothetical protein
MVWCLLSWRRVPVPGAYSSTGYVSISRQQGIRGHENATVYYDDSNSTSTSIAKNLESLFVVPSPTCLHGCLKVSPFQAPISPAMWAPSRSSFTILSSLPCRSTQSSHGQNTHLPSDSSSATSSSPPCAFTRSQGSDNRTAKALKSANAFHQHCPPWRYQRGTSDTLIGVVLL